MLLRPVSLEFSDGPRAYLPADTKEWKGLKNELHIFLPHPRLIEVIDPKQKFSASGAGQLLGEPKGKKIALVQESTRCRCYSKHPDELILSKV